MSFDSCFEFLEPDAKRLGYRIMSIREAAIIAVRPQSRSIRRKASIHAGQMRERRRYTCVNVAFSLLISMIPQRPLCRWKTPT